MEWSDLIEDVRIELGLLRQLMDESQDLIREVEANRHGPVEGLASGSSLQSFYNGVEKVFTMIAEEVDGGWEKGANARRMLLEFMGQPTDKRKAVLDEQLLEQLRRYLEFREAFRYAHFFHLTWEETAPLVIDLPKALGVFETQLDAFLTDAAGQPAGLDGKPVKMPRYWTQPLKTDRRGVPVRPLVFSCVAAAVLGVTAGAMFVKIRYRDNMPKDIRANVIEQRVFETTDLSFTEPSGNERRLPIRHAGKPFAVTGGNIKEYSDDPFTGSVASKTRSDTGIPVLRISFENGKAILVEAVNEQGEVERATLSDKKLLRYALCRPDGLPYRTYHITRNGKVSCVIERGRFNRPGATKAPEGWHYRFYHKGAEAVRMFLTDGGQILQVQQSEVEK